MPRYMKMENGIPTTVDESLAASTYQASYPVSAPLSSGATITLPDGETYNGTLDELKVERNGIGWKEGIEFSYQVLSNATYITLNQDVPSGGTIDFYKVS